MTKFFIILKREFFDLRFAKFLIFGSLAAIINLAIGGLLYSGDEATQLLPYWLAVTVGGVAALIAGFILNLHFNFQYSGRPTLAMFQTYTTVALGGLVLSVVLASIYLKITELLYQKEGFYIGSQYLSFEFISHFFSVGSVAIYSYLSHKYFTFNIGIFQQLERFLKKGRR